MPFWLLASVLAAPPVSASEPPREPILRLEAGVHTAIINKAAVTRDGRILTVSDDKTARLWTPEGGIPLVLRVPIDAGDEGALYAAAASPVKDFVLVAGYTGISWDANKNSTVYVINLATGRLVGALGGQPGTIHALAYSKDGKFLAIGTGGGPGRFHLRVFNLAEKHQVSDDGDYGGTVTAAEFLADGRLVTASLDGKLRLYDTDFRLIATHALPEQQSPWHIAVAPDGSQLVAGSRDAPKVHIVSTDGLKPLSILSGAEGRKGGFPAVAWSGSRLLFAAGTYGGDAKGTSYLYTWDLGGGTDREIPLSSETVTDLTPLPDGRIAFTTAEPSLGLIDPHSLAVTSIQKPASADFRDAGESLRVSPDGSAVQFGMRQGGQRAVRFDLSDKTLVFDPRPRADLSKPLLPKEMTEWRNAHEPRYRKGRIVLSANELARAVAGSADGSSVLLGADYSLRLLRGPETVWATLLQAPAWGVTLTRDGRYALAALGDGTIRWYRADTGTEMSALFATTDGRWIAWTPEGYFDHSAGAESLVGYHLNRGKSADPEFVHSGQIHFRFYRPDRLAQKLHGQEVAPSGEGDAKAVVAKHAAPEVSLIKWCSEEQCKELGSTQRSSEVAITVHDPELILEIGLADRGSGIGRVVVRRNGAAIATRSTTVRKDTKARVETHTVKLAQGVNRLSLTAYDGQGVVGAGEPIQLVVKLAEPAAQPRKAGVPGSAAPILPALHLVSVGINRYRNAQVPQLSNAANDAKGIAELLAQARNGLFSAAHASVLTEDQATLASIQSAVKKVADRAQPEDTVLVFLAGHGVVIDGKYYFLPYDLSGLTDPEIKGGGLSQDTLADMVALLPTARVTILLDTCYAGGTASQDTMMRRSRDRTVGGSLAYSTGRSVLTGTSNAQEALDGIDGHGVFTSVVLDALKGRADTEWKGDKDGRVAINELFQYTQHYVPEAAQKASPGHKQEAQWFFAGSEFFPISMAPKP